MLRSGMLQWNLAVGMSMIVDTSPQSQVTKIKLETKVNMDTEDNPDTGIAYKFLCS